jgi:hypothetical protein
VGLILFNHIDFSGNIKIYISSIMQDIYDI